tara:strand:- start:3360 stop:3803 length:444 start_codon:yes stop_codon:yes gene_type:complete
MPNPVLIFILLFAGIPLIELFILIEVGSNIGALATILLSIFTAIFGAALVRLQGISILFRAQEMVVKGAAPTIEILEGTILLLVGFALLLPGFVTDIVGFLLLIPIFRRFIIIRYFNQKTNFTSDDQHYNSDKKKDSLIEGEYHKDD